MITQITVTLYIEVMNLEFQRLPSTAFRERHQSKLQAIIIATFVTGRND